MECSVCYCETGSFCKLVCGHSFCNSCVKAWYNKSSSPTCPMCRRTMYFRGFQKVKDQWDDDAWETKCSEAYGAAVDEMIEEGFEFANSFGPKTRKRVLKDLLTDIKEIESTYNFLKSREVASEDIEYILTDTDEYYSDRHMDKCFWIDEPVKDFATRYPGRSDGVAGGARCRALVDEWATLNFIVVF